jgi:uncharacterized protein (DUF362 family)
MAHPSTINATIGIKQKQKPALQGNKKNNCTPSHDRRPVGTMILSYTFRALDTTKSSLLPVAEIGIEVKHQAMQEGLECSRTIFVSPWALERRHGSKPQVNPERMITQNAGREVRVCK